MTSIEKILNSFPKTRPPLNETYQKIFVEEYKFSREGSGLVKSPARLVSGWMHKQISKRGIKGAVLEIGAGTLNHLPHEEGVAAYDVVEPFTELYFGSPQKKTVRTFFLDIAEVPLNSRYSRIFSIGVLEHVLNLPLVIAKSRELLEENGIFQAAFPSEGGFLWGVGWRMTTGLSFRFRRGLDYTPLVRHEHVNNAKEIVALIRHFFDRVYIKRFPLPFHHFSFFTYIEARKPD